MIQSIKEIVIKVIEFQLDQFKKFISALDNKLVNLLNLICLKIFIFRRMKLK
jgi:hypothetical protein